jgi:hypothetical protein
MSVNSDSHSTEDKRLVLNSTTKSKVTKSYYDGNKEVNRRLEMLKRHQENQRLKAANKLSKRKSQSL